METQVVIIGGGLMGTTIARELSRYKVDAVLVERHPDVCFGISKASNGMIYSGLKWLTSVALKAVATGGGSAESHMEKDKLCLDGYNQWEHILRELDVPYLTTGTIVIARSADEMERLRQMQEMALPEWNIKLVDRDSLFSIEPNVTPDAIGALYGEGHLLNQYPWEVVIALAENARENGIKMMLKTKVHGFSQYRKPLIQAGRWVDLVERFMEYVMNAFASYALEVLMISDIGIETFGIA